MTLGRLLIFTIFAALGSSVLVSCSTKKDRPDGILSHNEMVNALTNVYLAEQITNRLGLKSDSATKILYRLKPEFLRKKEISDSAFNKSFDYYIERPSELEEIYVAVVDSLTLKEQLLNVSPP